LGFFDSSILRFFDFCLDDGQEIEGGARTDPTSILRFLDFSIYVWTGTKTVAKNLLVAILFFTPPSKHCIQQWSNATRVGGSPVGGIRHSSFAQSAAAFLRLALLVCFDRNHHNMHAHAPFQLIESPSSACSSLD
jgi:hypothetical protein